MTLLAESATGLERIFAAIGTGIDDAGHKRAPLFLARLTLLLATELQDDERTLTLISEAAVSAAGE